MATYPHSTYFMKIIVSFSVNWMVSSMILIEPGSLTIAIEFGLGGHFFKTSINVFKTIKSSYLHWWSIGLWWKQHVDENAVRPLRTSWAHQRLAIVQEMPQIICLKWNTVSTCDSQFHISISLEDNKIPPKMTSRRRMKTTKVNSPKKIKVNTKQPRIIQSAALLWLVLFGGSSRPKYMNIFWIFENVSISWNFTFVLSDNVNLPLRFSQNTS